MEDQKVRDLMNLETRAVVNAHDDRLRSGTYKRGGESFPLEVI